MGNQQEIDKDVRQASEHVPGWEREVLEKVALAAITEQRRARRWSVFFKMLMFLYLIVVGAMAFYPRFEKSIADDGGNHTAIVDVVGVIAENEQASAETIIEGLREALKDKQTKGVILNINSPGGSPVQAAYIFSEIRRLKEKHPDIPIYAVVSDLCASAGYYVAAAADEIYVNQASMIGSIGVIMNGFGFVNVMQKLGVDRRLLIAGEHKAMLDPFSPVNGAETKHMQTLLDDVHQQFIQAVQLGRGERLVETEGMFTGLIWTGSQGIKLGLADGLGSVDSVARDVIGTKKKVNFTPQERFFDKIAGRFGASFGRALASAVSEFSIR